MKKFTWILVVVLALVMFGGAGYYIYQKNQLAQATSATNSAKLAVDDLNVKNYTAVFQDSVNF